MEREFENTMEAINETYGYDYYWDDLSDYTNLSSELPGHDILLIPEQEKGNSATMKTIGAAWANTLINFVNNGGIVILMDCWTALGSESGPTSHIYNASGLMQINEINSASSGYTVNVVNTSDALARGVTSSFSTANGAVTFNISDDTSVVEDAGNDSLVVHKIMGQGHIVILGFDMYNRNSDFDMLLANAIRLHQHVVFDSSHNAYGTIFDDLSSFADDLVAEGFAVSNMGTFSPAFFNACDVLVISAGTTTYTSAEVDAIESFVQNGGGLFVATDWGTYGEELDPITTRFGFTRYATDYITDFDDTIAGDSYNVYDGDNIVNHSTTLGVTRVELDRNTGFSALPSNAITLIRSDNDGTSIWHGGGAANNVPLAAAIVTTGNGRVTVIADWNFMDDSTNPDGDGDMTYFDSNNDDFLINSIRWLSAADLQEHIVLFDESHNPTYNLDPTYLEFAKYLTNNGFTVHWMGTFHTSFIAQADILVIVDGTINYTNSEITAIKEFVAAGGGLLLVSDHTSYGTEVDPIGNEFGLDLNTNSGWLIDSDDGLGTGSYINYNYTNIGNHPITQGVSHIEIDRSPGFTTLGNGIALLTTDTDSTCTWSGGGFANGVPVIAATTYELGGVVFIPDMEFFGTANFDGDDFLQLYEHDNILLTVNALQWLVATPPESNNPSDQTIEKDVVASIPWVLTDTVGSGYYRVLIDNTPGPWYPWTNATS
ncbi:MAG: hypothetical protein ACFFD2_13220, partial [Promethearchaeota archaeon]